MSIQARLRAIRESGRFAAELLIAPWPPFALALVAIAAVGAATPLLQIYETARLIDRLTAHLPVSAAAPRKTLPEIRVMA